MDNEIKKSSINLQLFADGGDDNGSKDQMSEEDKRVQSIVDKAVTKALATQKAKLDAAHNEEISSLQNKLNSFEEKGLTDAEKVAKQLKEAADAKKSYEVEKQKLQLEKSFAKMGITEEDYLPVISDYLSSNFISANEKLGEIIEKRANELAAQKYNEAVSKIPNPNGGNSSKDGEMTKAKFDKLTYTEQMELLEKHPEYAKFL